MLKWLWLTVVVVVLDQVTKGWADQALTYGLPVEILPVFDLRLAYNTGAAFSFLADAGGWQRWLFSLLAGGVSIWLFLWLKKLPKSALWLAIALALILGGALGNLYDRVLLGHVIDFISVHYQQHYFPAFNIADSAITLGAIMFIIDIIRHPENHSDKPSDSNESA